MSIGFREMTSSSSSSRQKNLPYWPSTIGQAIVFGPFEITLSSQKEDDFLIERILQMTYSNKDGFVREHPSSVLIFISAPV